MVRRYLSVRPIEPSYSPVVFTPMERMMRDMFRIFGDGRSEGYSSENEGGLSIPRGDFYRKDGKVCVEFELPGIDPSSVELNVYEDRLTLKAEKKDEKTVDENDYFRSERYYGTVSRSIQFPTDVDPESAEAEFKNGVLSSEIKEKAQTERMKKVEISGGRETVDVRNLRSPGEEKGESGEKTPEKGRKNDRQQGEDKPGEEKGKKESR